LWHFQLVLSLAHVEMRLAQSEKWFAQQKMRIAHVEM